MKMNMHANMVSYNEAVMSAKDLTGCPFKLHNSLKYMIGNYCGDNKRNPVLPGDNTI